jgi:hypothetical protein
MKKGTMGWISVEQGTKYEGESERKKTKREKVIIYHAKYL